MNSHAAYVGQCMHQRWQISANYIQHCSLPVFASFFYHLHESLKRKHPGLSERTILLDLGHQMAHLMHGKEHLTPGKVYLIQRQGLIDPCLKCLQTLRNRFNLMQSYVN